MSELIVIPNRIWYILKLDDQEGDGSRKREYGYKFLSDYCEAIGILLLGRSDQGQDWVQDDKHK